MRSSIAAALVLFTSSSVFAGSGGGGPPPGRGDSTGALGHVSGGLGQATGGPSRDSGPATSPRDEDRTDPDYRGMYHRRRDGNDIILVDTEGHLVRRISPRPEPNRMAARVDAFLGVQKVVDSDSAFSASLAITDDWFRLAATGTHYREERMDGGGTLTMNVGSATFGFPLQIGGGSLAVLEGGVAVAKTKNDPVQDTSITGAKVGLHLEQPLRETTLVGDAHALLFGDHVHAYEARIGVRYGHLEGAVRVLDFNVGPPLVGPELGLAF